MQTIEAFEQDILLQVQFLQKFKSQKPLSEAKQKKSIFCGCGDSFAAALLAESFSNFKVRAADPLDLLKNKQIAKNSELYLVSISGNTISNIKVAKIARKSIAITTDAKNNLARACSDSILLKYPHSGVFTSGSIGFVCSALTCISLVTKIQTSANAKGMGISNLFKNAMRQSKRIKLGKNINNHKVFILGDLNTYPVAMYAAAKLYEVLGVDAHYERIEQFSHMGLFCVAPDDVIIIFEHKESVHTLQLVKNLKKAGLNIIQPKPQTAGNKIEAILFFIFVAQLVPLLYAKKNRQKDCHFVTATKLRDASSNMIY